MSTVHHFGLTKFINNTFKNGCRIDLFNISGYSFITFIYGSAEFKSAKIAYSSFKNNLINVKFGENIDLDEFVNEIITIIRIFYYPNLPESGGLLKLNLSSFKYYKKGRYIKRKIKEIRKSRSKMLRHKINKLTTKLLINSYWEKFISQSLDENEFNRISYLAQD